MASHAAAGMPLSTLRQTIARIEGRLYETLGAEPRQTDLTRQQGRVLPARLVAGVPDLDLALGGGLPAAALTELHGKETRDAASVAGFSLALLVPFLAKLSHPLSRPLVWISTTETANETGRPYPLGLNSLFGLSARQLLFVQAPKLSDALWIAEEAASLKALSAIVLEIRGQAARIDLTATQRLHLRARQAGHPVILMRQAGSADPTAAPVRLIVEPAPSGLRETRSALLPQSIGPPRFLVEISKARAAVSSSRFLLEWNAHERALHACGSIADDRTAYEPAHSGSAFSLSGDGQDLETAARAVVALDAARAERAAAGHKSSRPQRPAYRSA